MFTLYGMWFLSLTTIYLTRSQCIIIKQIGRVHCKMTKLLGIDWFCTHSCFVIKSTDDKLLTPNQQKIIIFTAQGT